MKPIVPKTPWLVLACFCCLVSIGFAGHTGARPVNVRNIPQLFLDDHVIERRERVERQFHIPIRYEANPILEADRPWERHGGSGVCLLGGTVLYDEEEQLFKMWYRAEILEKREPLDYRYIACYATSRDGLKWEKPNLAQTDFQGSTANNILPPGLGGSGFVRRPNLIKDYDEPDPTKRYKMVYMDRIEGKWRLAKAYSADGIHWRMNVGTPAYFVPPVWPNGELFGWDARNQRYVLFHHKSSGSIPLDVEGRKGHAMDAIVRSASSDFETWGETQEAFKRDPRIDPPRWEPGHLGVFAGTLYTEDLYVGFLATCVPHSPEEFATFSTVTRPLSADQWRGVFASEHVEHLTELVISRDGIHWNRIAPHMAFPQPGLWDSWDHEFVALTKPIVRNGEILIYYSGSDVPCKGYDPAHPLSGRVLDDVEGRRSGYAIGVSKLRLDGFASMEGYDPEGVLTTRPLVFDGDRLMINVHAPEKPVSTVRNPPSPYGTLRVEVLDEQERSLPGFGLSECDPITGNETRRAVTWKGKSSLSSLSGKTIRLRFHLRNAALYAFQFTSGSAAPGALNLLCPGCRGRPGRR